MATIGGAGPVGGTAAAVDGGGFAGTFAAGEADGADVAGALAAPFGSGSCAPTLWAGAADGGDFTGAVTIGGRTGVFWAVVAGGVTRGDGGERNHAISAMRTMASIATCSIERARRGLSDL